MVKLFSTPMGMFIGKEISEDETYIKVESPRMISVSHQNPKQLDFVPFPPFSSSDEMYVAKNHLICKPYEVEEELSSQYLAHIHNITIAKNIPEEKSNVTKIFS